MSAIPTNPISADWYLGLGILINRLEDAKGRGFGEVLSNITNFMNHANLLSFVFPKQAFDYYMANLKRFEENNPSLLIKGGLPEGFAVDLNRLVNTTAETIIEEAKKRQTIVLNSSMVSDRLKQLPDNILTDSQKHLRQETVRCLECGIFRSAAVMGWNFAYDCIRQWVFVNRRAQFNGILTSKYKNKKGEAIFDSIDDPSDFFEKDAPGEKIVLDTLFEAEIIGGNVHEDLKKHLRQRNQYAHPSDRIPTAHQVNGFIEDLIDIIERPPFKIKEPAGTGV